MYLFFNAKDSVLFLHGKPITHIIVTFYIHKFAAIISISISSLISLIVVGDYRIFQRGENGRWGGEITRCNFADWCRCVTHSVG